MKVGRLKIIFAFLLCGFIVSAAKSNCVAQQPERIEKPLTEVNAEDAKNWDVRRVELVWDAFASDYVIRKNSNKCHVQEGDVFSVENVRCALKRMNKTGLFQKVTEKDVSCRFSRKYHEVDLTIVFKARTKKEKRS